MTPNARISAAIALLDALESAPRRPADAVANDFFRARRFIGGGDRRAVADRAWGVVRERARLDWHLDHVGAAPTGRLLMAAHMMLVEGGGLAGVEAAFNGGQYAERPLSGEERRLLAKIEGRGRR